MQRTMPASTTGEIFCDTGSAAIARASGESSRTLARRRAAATADAAALCAALCAASARYAGDSRVIIVNQTTSTGRYDTSAGPALHGDLRANRLETVNSS